MKMALKLGPADHGRELTDEEFESAEYEEGYRYELIAGRLFVSPFPSLPHEEVVAWLEAFLTSYCTACPQVINRVATPARVFVPGAVRSTRPEPDLAAYHNYPFHIPRRERHWRDVSPVLVAEVVSEDNAEKDLVRNVGLYAQVPSIQEYWLVDPGEDDARFVLRVYRRGRGRRWRRPVDVPFGATYTTPLLPGFSLPVDPDARP
jgi:Uma2 family endonuclease